MEEPTFEPTATDGDQSKCGKQGTWSMQWQRDRQIDTQLLLAVQEASMPELISTEIPITVRTFLWLLLIVSLSILVALDCHIKALVFNYSS